MRATSPAEEQTYIYITPCKHDPAAHTHKAADDAAAEEASDEGRAAKSSAGIHTCVWMQRERTHARARTHACMDASPHMNAHTHACTHSPTDAFYRYASDECQRA